MKDSLFGEPNRTVGAEEEDNVEERAAEGGAGGRVRVLLIGTEAAKRWKAGTK